ncbi:uncharacterized protein N7503_011390 [Penicillium pulvis]|uniref:uncharacterized protein n=1 Tax=Penicillium pulvis TaxID=1562058 RepID=UPI002548F28E|nr:uncharacterized protein N7503_011390 [Penicillium pulvis]KAJ5786178.1 hypothetical protein N7503_011390 [Penicillium pulvis]
MSANEESLLIQRSIADDQDLENGSTRSKIGTSFLAVMLLCMMPQHIFKDQSNGLLMTAAFLASSDDSFVLSTASDIAADFEATNIIGIHPLIPTSMVISVMPGAENVLIYSPILYME